MLNKKWLLFYFTKDAEFACFKHQTNISIENGLLPISGEQARLSEQPTYTSSVLVGEQFKIEAELEFSPNPVLVGLSLMVRRQSHIALVGQIHCSLLKPCTRKAWCC